MPAVVPIVMYNGADNWTAVRTFKEYLQEYEKFGEYTIDFKYFLFDVNRAADDAESSMKELLDIVFMLDKKTSREDVEKSLTAALNLMKRLDAEDKEDLYDWIANVWLSHVKDEQKKAEFLQNFVRGEVEQMNSGLSLLFEEERMKAAKEATEVAEKKAAVAKEAATEAAEKKAKAAEKIEIAKKLLKRGLSIQDIAEDTGLSVAAIEKEILRQKNAKNNSAK